MSRNWITSEVNCVYAFDKSLFHIPGFLCKLRKKKGNVWLRTLKCVEHWSRVVTAVFLFFYFKEFIS